MTRLIISCLWLASCLGYGLLWADYNGAAVSEVNGAAVSEVNGAAIASEEESGVVTLATFDFTGSNSTSAPTGWTTDGGTVGTLSNRLTERGGGWADGSASCDTTMPSVKDPWLSTQLWNAGANRYAAMYLLSADNLSSGIFVFYNMESPGAVSIYANGVQRGSTQNMGALVNGDKISVTVELVSGTTYNIRLWKNQTANAPVARNEWDSGDTTPTLEWLSLDLVSVTPGTSFGLGGVSSAADVVQFDNVYLGYFN